LTFNSFDPGMMRCFFGHNWFMLWFGVVRLQAMAWANV